MPILATRGKLKRGNGEDSINLIAMCKERASQRIGSYPKKNGSFLMPHDISLPRTQSQSGHRSTVGKKTESREGGLS